MKNKNYLTLLSKKKFKTIFYIFLLLSFLLLTRFLDFTILSNLCYREHFFLDVLFEFLQLYLVIHLFSHLSEILQILTQFLQMIFLKASLLRLIQFHLLNPKYLHDSWFHKNIFLNQTHLTLLFPSPLSS